MTTRTLHNALKVLMYGGGPKAVQTAWRDVPPIPEELIHIGQRAIIPIKAAASGPLANLPNLDENLEPPGPGLFARAMADMLKDSWDSEAMHRQFYGGWIEPDPDQAAWDSAVAWIAARHAPPKPEKPVVFDWNWPSLPVDTDPRRGSINLEVDWDDEDEDEDW